MDKHLHHDLTKRWSLEIGFKEAQSEQIAAASRQLDQKWWTKPWIHFKIAGALVFAYLFLLAALVFSSLRLLGFAVHAIQDSISHGWMMPWNHNRKYPEVDDWRKAPEEKKERIEIATKVFMQRFQATRRKR